MMRVALKKGFSCPVGNLTDIARDAGKLLGWGTVVSLFEMNQNRIWLDPGKTVHILKTIFQYFYSLVIQIHQFMKCVMFYVWYIF